MLEGEKLQPYRIEEQKKKKKEKRLGRHVQQGESGGGVNSCNFWDVSRLGRKFRCPNVPMESGLCEIHYNNQKRFCKAYHKQENKNTLGEFLLRFIQWVMHFWGGGHQQHKDALKYSAHSQQPKDHKGALKFPIRQISLRNEPFRFSEVIKFLDLEGIDFSEDEKFYLAVAFNYDFLNHIFQRKPLDLTNFDIKYTAIEHNGVGPNRIPTLKRFVICNKSMNDVLLELIRSNDRLRKTVPAFARFLTEYYPHLVPTNDTLTTPYNTTQIQEHLEECKRALKKFGSHK